MSEFVQRRKDLWRKVQAQNVDAFLLVNVEATDQPNLRYLSGFTGTFGVLILTGQEGVLLTDPRYTEQAQIQTDLPVVEVRGRWLPQVVDHLRGLGVKRVGLGSTRLTLHLFEELKKAGEGLEFVPLGAPVEELRRIKTKAEVQKIQEAVELTEAGLQRILREIKPGQTEREVALALEFWYRREGADDVAFDLIVAAGPRSSRPHHRAGPEKLEAGGLVLFDIGVRLDGYCADITRVVAVGKPHPRAQEAYTVVLAANRMGIEAVRAGAGGKEVDAAARRIIEEAGLGELFGHGLGHGVGLEVHEGPRLSPTSEDTLLPGMVVTVEPGVYFPGELGVRIEDVVVVEENGARVLSSFPKDELLVLPAR